MKKLAAALIALGIPGPAAAWGPTGHRVVGRIAERHLTPEAAAAVAVLLAPDSLARVTTWADEVRSDPGFGHADPWHYISIEDGETYESTEKNPEGDVVEASRRMVATLADPAAARPEKAKALKFLAHFVGDLHQPLHVGRRADRGGNEVLVTWRGAVSNLHSVWDYDMIDATRLSFSEYAELIDHPSVEEVVAWQGSTLLDWIAESKELRARVYEIGDGRLGSDYSYRNLPVVERRMLQAGVRLAGLLNSTFSPAGAAPGRAAPPPRRRPP